MLIHTCFGILLAVFISVINKLLITLWITISINKGVIILEKGLLTRFMEDTWNKTLPLLENTMTKIVYDQFISVVTPHSYENGVFTLLASKEYHKEAINIRHIQKITRCVRTVTDNNDLEVIVISPEDFNKPKSIATKQPTQSYEDTNLRQRYVFETFVKGKCNELAYNAARAAAESPDTCEYNPLFLYGGVGLGKTHLMQSIGNRARELFPDIKIMYVSSETFTNEFITAIVHEDTGLKFKDKYRNVDILLVDDVQFLAGKTGTQEELFHTFNELYSANKQIVLTSDLPPKELKGLEVRLTSRFAAGLIADVNIPDYETRTAILEAKLNKEKVAIPQDVKDFITRNIVSNIRDLEGALNKVMAWATLSNATITLELAEHALKDQLVNAEKPEATMEFIQQVIASHFKITTDELNSRKRAQSISFPRQIAMYLCRKILDKSLPDIGKFFGGRDHSTVIHSCEKIANELEMDDKLRDLIENLESRIKGE